MPAQKLMVGVCSLFAENGLQPLVEEQLLKQKTLFDQLTTPSLTKQGLVRKSRALTSSSKYRAAAGMKDCLERVSQEDCEK